MCVEMCIQALKMTSTDHKDTKSTICKTISCLLPTDLEVKRACQLTEFLLQPAIDSYYAVESLYNEPDQKPEEDGSLPVPNSLRCELLLALKTQWPFDPEFWDWKTLKRNCLALMGEEAGIVSSIDTFNDTDEQEVETALGKLPEYRDLEDFLLTTTNELNEITDEREKNREAKKLREQGFVSARFRNWRAYMQYCVLCDKEFLGHRIVRHAQKHFKDGVYLCPICADSFESREVLEPHVASHVKQSCKERLAAMKAARKVTKPPQSPKSPLKNPKVAVTTPFKVESQIKPEQTTSDANMSQDCFCPVKNCSKAFKFFRNLMAHVRSHKDDEEATRFLEIQKQKVVCQYCRRQFVNVRHLNDHLQIHCGTKPYICIQLDCKASFNSNSELLMHRKTHPEFKAQCMFPNCGQVFNEAYLLYDHEAQHYLTYTCQTDNCGKVFHSQSQYLSHQEIHNISYAVNSLPLTNQNPPVTPKVQSPLASTPSLERIVTDSEMKEASRATASPCTLEEMAKEGGPLRVKHSIESMLNCSDQVLDEPEKCYTPLTNPTPAPIDTAPAPPQAASAQNDVAPAPEAPQLPQNLPEHAEITPVYTHMPNAPNAVASQQREGLNYIQGNDVPKAVLQAVNPEKIKTEIPSSLQGYPSNTPSVTAGGEENQHCCPYNDCTRAYSTNKSLSRHVKKQHPEIFEDWKLAKKYNRVAKITSKKASRGPGLPFQPENAGNRPPNQPGILCKKPGMQQMDYPAECSSSPAQCYPGSMEPVPITPMVNPSLYPPWGNSNNASGIMQSDMAQSWSSPPVNNCYSDAFNMNEYPSRSYPQWQADPYQTTTPLQSDRDHAMAAMHGPSVSHTPSDSSLMSQYVSSSLMLDNGGQMHNGGHHQYGIMPPEGSADSVDLRKTNENMTSQDSAPNISTIDSLPEGNYHAQYDQHENSSHAEDAPVDIHIKCLSREAQVALKAAEETVKTDSVSTPYEPMDTADPNTVSHPEFPYEDDCPNADCEMNTPEDKSVDPDTQNAKRSRMSKRTKWPAIIKDGKVICRRCFREFASTKSLGGHLSKRSQCRPVDEIDLTADLPTSFLDFLNDPHVPDTNGALFMPNGDFSQESCSLTPLSAPTQLKQEPQNTNVTEFSTPVTVSPENQQEKQADAANPATAVPYQEDHLVEISHAFQRLDLIEAAQEKMRSALALGQNVSHGATAAVPDKSKILTKSDDKPTEKVHKPFKCDQEDCDYSFMTKEALFRHLTKMHDYTNEMIEELKRTPSKLSPYPCQICPKTFTRTTGLRIHYEKVHRLSKAEIQKLKISGRNRRAFRLNKDGTVVSQAATDSTSGPATQSAAALPAIKQEPLDISIAQQADIDNTPETVQINSPKEAGNQDFDAEATTVTQLPSSPTYLTDNLFGEVPPSGHVPAPENPQVAVVHNSPDLMQKSEIHEKVSLSVKAALQQGQTDESPNKANEPKSIPASASSSPDKPGSSKNTPTKDESHKKERAQKRLSVKMCETDNGFSPYRPYRCVHEGCSAAFTIQQNLILHYRAMHQAALPPSKNEAEPEVASVKSVQENNQSPDKDEEVRCQVKDCSRVFMGVTRLVQHYLLLHKFARDKATAMMASMDIGTFHCDRPECALPFNSVDKYIEHIKNFHKEIAISESGSVDRTFKCEYDECDRVYSTKSNLLRHLIKKHNYVYDPKRTDGRRTKSVGLFSSVTDGKENMESKLKLKKKNTKKKDVKSIEHWTSFGKPTLKTHEEASAMCTKKSALQYPCMIIGCDTVEFAERNIFKHYTTHGLTERYIEDQRSQFIFCKKFPRARFKDSSKTEGAMTSSSEETEAEDGEKPSEENTEEPLSDSSRVEQDDSKLSNDDSAESRSSTGTEGGTKRGRPKKPAHPTPACAERMQTLRNRTSVTTSRENSNPGTPTAQEQREDGVSPVSFKPLGLEDSFLKFLEASESTQPSKRKFNDKSGAELPPKRQLTHKQKSIRGKIAECEILVDFRNPVNLKSANNVKIVIDKTFSDGADLLLKQLQDMKPLVIIKKWFYSGS